jgi:tetratricopeptide (TPR) repeat protein
LASRYQRIPRARKVEIEYEKVWRNLANRPIESLVDLPQMTNPEMQAAMRVLSVLFAPAYFTDRNLLHLHMCQMVNLTLEHGTTDASAHGYACFGVTIGPNFGRYLDGYRFCKLACDLVERLDLLAYKAKVYFSAEMAVLWTQPVGTALQYIRAAHRAAVESGDPTIGCYSCNHTVTDLLLQGEPLDDVWRETELGLEFARKAKFRDVVDVIVAQQRFIDNMRGRTASFSSFSDAAFDEAAFEAALTEERMATMVCWYWIIKLQARYLSGDYDSALDAARKAEALLWSSDGHIQLLDYHFYAALATLAAWNASPPDGNPPGAEPVAAHLRELRQWAEHGAVTFRDRYALLSAEVARVEGRELDAERLYEEAIRLSREHRFIQNEALANERAARFYAARGFGDIGTLYLRKARDCYLRWGADGKVRQLDHAYAGLRGWRGASPADEHDRRARRASRPRDSDQGFPGYIGRDRPREDARHPDAHGSPACRRRARPAHPGADRRAADRSGGHHGGRQGRREGAGPAGRRERLAAIGLSLCVAHAGERDPG